MLNCQVLTVKNTANKSKHLLVENESKKLKTFDSSYFVGKSRFEEDGTQNCLVFQPISKYFKVIANTKFISSCKSKGLSGETITPYATTDSLTPLIDHHVVIVRLTFNGSCLKQPNKLTYDYEHKRNVYIV